MEEKQYVIDSLSIDESWRVFRIMAEFVEGIETLSKVHNAVTFSVRPDSNPIIFIIKRQKHWPGFWFKTDLV